MSDIGFSVIFFACVCISFLLSGMEAGLFQLNRLRLRNMGRRGDQRANVLLQYLEKPEQFLWTILVGNILANVVVVTMGAVYIKKLIPCGVTFWTVFLFFVFAFYLVCDLIPKMLFRFYATPLCLPTVYPFKFIYTMFSPIVIIINQVAKNVIKLTGGKAYTGKIFASREEIKHFMREASAGLSREELMMIDRVLDIKNITVKHLTIPFQKVTAVDLRAPISEALNLFNKTGYSHLPVIQKKNGDIAVAGIISLRDVIYHVDTQPTGPDQNKPSGKNENSMSVSTKKTDSENNVHTPLEGADSRPTVQTPKHMDSQDVSTPVRTIAHYIKPALFIHEDVKLEDALKKLQRSGRKLAIVLNSEHKEIGIITLNDILGFMFGEVEL
ncbi:MAG: CNNM domain-containing protein [Verrucomicrobiae bacterium]|nr:CNNM domain-containing protein [Verrucomicrobiae bacterium]